MKISKEMGNSIVLEISRTVKKDVNLMDEAGIIIASTIENRIGTLHLGAKKIIDEKLECLTIDTDQQYVGSKIGVNVPIYFKNKIIGVIGISGEWAQIEQYMQLIKKAVEILVMEFYMKEKEQKENSDQSEYIHRLLFDDPEEFPEDFYQIGSALGINVEVPRRCFALTFVDENKMVPETIKENLLLLKSFAKEYLDEGSQFFTYTSSSKLYIFISVKHDMQYNYAIGKFISKFVVPKNLVLKIGVDEKEHVGIELRKGLIRAQKSLKLAMKKTDVHVLYYKELTYGLFIDELTPATKKRYMDRIFKDVSEEEREEWIKILEVFYAMNGSIAETSAKLFLHKNTLQYQLKKLARMTGYDPRDISDAGKYQMAIEFYRS